MGSPQRVAWVVSLGASTVACAVFVGDGDPFKLYPGPPDAARDSASSGHSSSVDARSDASCEASLGLIAGNAMSLYAAVRSGAGAWSAKTIAPWAVVGVPILSPLAGGGYHAIFQAPGDTISWSLVDFVIAADGATTTPRDVPSGSTTNRAPAANDVLSLATLAGREYVVFNGAYAQFGQPVGYQGETFSPDAGDAGWSFTSAMQGGGPFPPTIAATSSYLIAAVGADAGADAKSEHLAVEVRSSGVWAPPTTVGVAAAGPPRLVALTGGADDLLLVYPRAPDGKLESIARNAASGSWSTAVLVAGGASTRDATVVAAYGNGSAVLVTRDNAGQPFGSVYSSSPTPAWSASIPFGPSTVNGPVTVGVACNQPFAAYALPDDVVRVVSLEGSTWSPPVPVAGTLNATYVAIAAGQS